ncbi:hypothetical protein [Chryseobacterium sp. IHB B 17019]|uniref:hypothetical protein n=1 Tax=Chryseobacterium sp. IHB B 17019 TaxID=1721091 RepID=UPI001F245445|nr:hypothetical protein [Chryseobacterium sp. IHB B 17019]
MIRVRQWKINFPNILCFGGTRKKCTNRKNKCRIEVCEGSREKWRQAREGENILYTFGFQRRPLYIPISIPTKSVLERCEVTGGIEGYIDKK